MKKLYYIIIAAIFLLSFWFYSSIFYPLLNTDNALTILMIHYFQLPHDLYCWGQDRMGSLIPLLGQIFFKGFHCSAIVSEVITHYLILLLGFFAFASFLKSNYLKIIFAIIWFFPPIRLIDVTQCAFGIHYSLIAMAAYLFVVYEKQTKKQGKIIFRHFLLASTTILLITSIWVSDMALISVFLFLTVNFYFYIRRNKLSTEIFKKLETYYFVFGTFIGYEFIHYAKKIADGKVNYETLSNFDEIEKTILIFYHTIVDFFVFAASELFTSIYAYFVIAVFVILALQLKNIKLNDNIKKWLCFFILDAAVLFAIIMVSKWTYLNGVPRRYFTCTYISLSFAILLLIDNIVNTENKKTIIKTIVFITVFVGGIGTLYNLKYHAAKTLTPKIKIASEFNKLGKIGIIADYWNSYINSCNNPDMIKATPHDTTWAVKNMKMVDEVFEQKNIYIIRDCWFDVFPDSITQFGRVLLKDGDEFMIGGCNVCKYKKAKI